MPHLSFAGWGSIEEEEEEATSIRISLNGTDDLN
jgi:hypothetical protein